MKEKIKITRYKENVVEELEDIVSSEVPLTIFLNGEQLLTLLCSPDKLEYLALGFLNSEGFITSKQDVESIDLNEKTTTIRIKTKDPQKNGHDTVFGKRVITSGCGKGMTFYDFKDFNQSRQIKSKIKISNDAILKLVNEFQKRSELFIETGGVHSAALTDGDKIVLFAEDLGRHNALDKVFGEAMSKDIQLQDKMVITSGRISSEITIKVLKRGIPILVSPSAPTNLAIRIAQKMDLTLVGFARGKRLSVYSGTERIM